MSVVLESTSVSSRQLGTEGGSGKRDQSVPLLQYIENPGRSKTTEGSKYSMRSQRQRKTSRESSAQSGFSKSGFKVSPSSANTGIPAAECARCRKCLVGWLFRPLLSDAFAMASLTKALSMIGMGGKRQASTLVKDMSAWFLELAVDRAADITVGCEAQNCPVLRWLKGIILLSVSSSPNDSSFRVDLRERRQAPVDGKAIASAGKVVRRVGDQATRAVDLFGDKGQSRTGAVGESSVSGDIGASPGGLGSTGGKGDRNKGRGDEVQQGEMREFDSGEDIEDVNFQAEAEAMLRPMYEACASCTKLENAIMLAVVAAEALSACRDRLEESSLGRVAIDGGETWIVFARRLRLCLFVNYRLNWEQPEGNRYFAYHGRIRRSSAHVWEWRNKREVYGLSWRIDMRLGTSLMGN